jgi:hypothetical protein
VLARYSSTVFAAAPDFIAVALSSDLFRDECSASLALQRDPK